MKKLLLLAVTGLLLLAAAAMVRAEETPSTVLLPSSKILFTGVRIKEFIQLNLLTFKKSSKALVLEEFTNQRIREMSYATSIKDIGSLDFSLNRYTWQKTKALEYAKAANDSGVVDQIKTRVLEQQRTLTKIQLQFDEVPDLQSRIVEVQKNVVSEVKNVVVVVQGSEGAAQVETAIKYIWRDPNADVNGNLPPLNETWEYAPGTEGRGEGQRVIEGYPSQWAPGTEGSGEGNEVIEQEVAE